MLTIKHFMWDIVTILWEFTIIIVLCVPISIALCAIWAILTSLLFGNTKKSKG